MDNQKSGEGKTPEELYGAALRELRERMRSSTRAEVVTQPGMIMVELGAGIWDGAKAAGDDGSVAPGTNAGDAQMIGFYGSTPLVPPRGETELRHKGATILRMDGWGQLIYPSDKGPSDVTNAWQDMQQHYGPSVASMAQLTVEVLESFRRNHRSYCRISAQTGRPMLNDERDCDCKTISWNARIDENIQRIQTLASVEE